MAGDYENVICPISGGGRLQKHHLPHFWWGEITKTRSPPFLVGADYEIVISRLEPVLVNKEHWKRNKTYLLHDGQIVVPRDRFSALPRWTHESSGHVGADLTLKLFKKWFHSTWSDDQLQKALQPILDKCRCRCSKPGDIMDGGLYSTLSHRKLCQQCTLCGLHRDDEVWEAMTSP